MNAWEIVREWTLAPRDERTVLALLIAGHMLGDFVFQSARTVERKRHSIGALSVHVGIVTALQALVLLPLLKPGASLAAGVVGVGVVALSHLAIDRAKGLLEIRDERRHGRPRFRWWILDQLAHLVSLFLAWRLMVAIVGAPGLALAVPQEWAPAVHGLAIAVAVLAFNVHGAGAIVGAVLDGSRGLPAGEAGPDRALQIRRAGRRGRTIGILERGLLILFVVFEAYGAIGFVLAGKSIARFKELEDRDFGEAYLVGTLASTLLAVAGGLVLLALL